METSDKPDIHAWFELTYAQYLVLPRVILQSMPDEWQIKFVELLQEFDAAFDWRRDGCWVQFKDCTGRFMHDELRDYERGRRILEKEEVAEIVERHNKKCQQ